MEIERLYSGFHRVMLVGVFPPPLGGVSVHLHRLSRLLNRRHLIRELNIEQAGQNRLRRILYLLGQILSFRPQLVHVHTTDLFVLKLLYTLQILAGIPLMFTAHNPRFVLNLSKRQRDFFSRFCKRLRCLIVVSEQVRESFEDAKIDMPEQTVVIDAFLPPPLDEESGILGTYPKEFLDSLLDCPLIVANAFRLELIENRDLYGFDMCIEAAIDLAKKEEDFKFVLALADEHTNKDYLSVLKKRIADAAVDDKIIWLTGQRELWPLFRRAHLMVRPTLTDGHPLSIDEAMLLGCKVVASDCTERPDGVVTFKSRDQADMNRKIQLVFGKA